MINQIKRIAEYVAVAKSLGVTHADRSAILWRLTKNLRVQLGIGSHHPNRVYQLRTVYGPLHFRDNFGDVTNLVSLVYPNVYQAAKLHQKGVILDVGANIGLAAALFAYFNPDRDIHCFEPLSDNTLQITRNCPTAHVHNICLGSVASSVTLQVDPDNVMASKIPTRWESAPQTFDVLSLDTVVQDSGIESIAVLKIDTEGMEYEILRGAEQTLQQTGQVAAETHDRDEHAQVVTALQEAGFQIDRQAFGAATGMVFASRPRLAQCTT